MVPLPIIPVHWTWILFSSTRPNIPSSGPCRSLLPPNSQLLNTKRQILGLHNCFNVISCSPCRRIPIARNHPSSLGPPIFRATCFTHTLHTVHSIFLPLHSTCFRASYSYKNACESNRASIAHFIFLTAREGQGESRCRIQINFSAFRHTIYSSTYCNDFSRIRSGWSQWQVAPWTRWSKLLHQANSSRNESCKAFDHHTVCRRRWTGSSCCYHFHKVGVARWRWRIIGYRYGFDASGQYIQFFLKKIYNFNFPTESTSTWIQFCERIIKYRSSPSNATQLEFNCRKCIKRLFPGDHSISTRETSCL